ncbi:non-ribosomal peptide synthetase [Amycolatopsis sp. NPDC049691]|uniref:non-ribosomal peptide synthetase n=1 Tax=Amycolatopsis sp. NPDC049691 TaxID=3155155 RepID=UPI003422C046
MTSALSVARGEPAPAVEHVLHRYEHWVAGTPEARCVVDGPRSWSYAELDGLARRIEGVLSAGLRPGDTVAVCLDRSATLVAIAVAVARLGAVYLPLGPRVGAGRLDDLLGRVRTAVVIGPPELVAGRGRARRLEVPADGANAVAEVTAAFLDPPPGAVAAPAGTFYSVLTSGSSGTPKAVAVGGAALANAVSYYNETADVVPGDLLSLLVAAQFDPHISELWCGLSSGAALAVAPDEVRYDPEALMRWLRQAEVEVAHVATPVAERVLSRPWPPGLRLRCLYIGGERLRRRPSPEVTAKVCNVYGPAEAIITTGAVIEPRADGSAPPIGRPVPGVDVCVVGQDGRLVARGEAGELLIGGACLSEGYLDEELTRERFVAGPAGSGLGRVYRSGDKVRMRTDDVLEYLGRLDSQVKISGVRIEPAEVEAVLEKDPGVNRAVVVVREHAGGAPTLAAFVRASGSRLDVDALLAAARSHLPEQAIPGEVHLVAKFPLNANGKVDTAALFAGAEAAEPAEAPAGIAERLAAIWRELLDVDEVDSGSNLFELGGNSMDAFKLATLVKETFGVHIPMKSVMTLRTLGRLAAAIDAEQAAARLPASGEHHGTW